MQLKSSRRGGFTLVEIMIVVAIIGLLAAIAIPNFVRARQTAHKNVCINNLRIMADAAQELRLERPREAVSDATIRPYLGRGAGGTMPTCPSGGTYADFDTIPTCTERDVGFEHILPQ